MKTGSKESKGDKIILGGTKNEMASWLSQLGLDSKYIGVDRLVSYRKKSSILSIPIYFESKPS